MRIARNIQAMHVQTSVSRANSKLSILSNQLSTGIKLNTVKDDASGYAIATKLENQVRGMEKANTNSLDGVSMAQTLDGALSSMTEMLQRARELSVQSANDSNSQSDRKKMQEELDQILAEVDTMQDTVNFNGKKLIGGDASRIVNNYDAPLPTDGSRPVEQNISEVNYVSNTVPEGNLQYDIVAPGKPAYYEINLPTGTGTAGSSGSFTVNDIVVEFSAGDTMDEINAKTLEAFEMAGLTYKGSSTGDGYVYTNEEGSNQEIIFGGDYATAGINLGANDKGTDIEIANVKYVDKDDATIEIDSFNDNMVIVVDGNDVSITSTNGQKIELDINFVGMDKDGKFYYGDEINPIENIDGKQCISQVTNYGGLTIQTGESKGMDVTVFIRELNTKELGIDNVKITTQQTANDAISLFDKAIAEVSTIRSEVGAYQNRFESIIENLDVATINTQTSLSRIRDIDMAKAMVEYTTEEVKMNAGLSVLQQANERPQSILQLM